MNNEVTYSLQTVIEDLGAKVGSLEVAIAQESAIKKAYEKRVNELATDNEDLRNEARELREELLHLTRSGNQPDSDVIEHE